MKTRRVPNKCAFCEHYKHSLGLKEEYKLYGVTVHLQVCLHERGMKNRRTNYTNTHRPMALNYCPTCGKELVKTKKKEELDNG
jgi:hypothetical protein